ncbi:MAG: terminase, partial [Sphingomonas hengshuiensis]
LFTFNPPTDAKGRWVVSFFGPWIDKRHPLYPTAPGVLRYVYTDPKTGKDVWLRETDPRPFVLDGGRRRYAFDPADFQPQDIITPESRTFIPSRITDNPYLVNTGYMRELQAMPEPLRSQMLYGDFEAGLKDDAFQVCPTAWVEAAMKRWRERAPRGEMLSMGIDVARGGDDRTIISTRHMADGCPWWFDRLDVHPGANTPNGNVVAGLVIGARRDLSPIHIDVVGVGASPYDILKDAGQDIYGINTGERATTTDKSGRLSFFNRKAQLWWRLRELLDPAADTGIALPPDAELLAELTAPRWELSSMRIKVENREEIIERVGRSVDKASAILLAAIETPKLSGFDQGGGLEDYDPYAKL